MQNPTHFIEVVKNNCTGKLINYNCQQINRLGNALQLTDSLVALKTIAVWKIKEKILIK